MKLKSTFKLKKIAVAVGVCTALLGLPAIAALPTPYIQTLAPIEDVNKALANEVVSNLGQAELAAYYGSPADPKKVALIQKLVEAGKIMDILFYKQLNTNNLITDSNGVMIGGILQDLQNPQYGIDSAYLRLFTKNYSQWDAGNGYEPFINVAETIPDGIELYPRVPSNFTADEWESYLSTLSDADAARFNYDFTVIRRGSQLSPQVSDALVAIPYASFGKPGTGTENLPGSYYNDLQRAATKLEEAAVLAGQVGEPTVQKYLISRAAALRDGSSSTHIFEVSDKDWVDLNDKIEITIGPYEQYLDSIAGVKAMYMEMIGITDAVATASLKYLEQPNVRTYLIKNMPYPSICGKKHNKLCGPSDFTPAPGAKLQVMNEVFSAGDYRQTSALAFYLPNNADSNAYGGAKNTIIKNQNKAAYDLSYVPLAKILTTKKDFAKINFDDFFNGVVTHEVGHSIDPNTINPSGADVNDELGRWYLTVEEELAETISSWNAYILSKAGKSLGAGNPYLKVNLDNFMTTYQVVRMRGMKMEGLDVDSHVRGRAIGFDHLMNFTDPCDPKRHAISFDKKGIITIDTDPINDGKKCPKPKDKNDCGGNQGPPLIVAAMESLGKTLLALELGSDATTTKDLEAARNTYACAKERLYGSANTMSTNPSLPLKRSSEPCCPAGLDASCLRGSPQQIVYPGTPGFLKALDNIKAAELPKILKKYPGLD